MFARSVRSFSDADVVVPVSPLDASEFELESELEVHPAIPSAPMVPSDARNCRRDLEFNIPDMSICRLGSSRSLIIEIQILIYFRIFEQMYTLIPYKFDDICHPISRS
jgi:hypothetical protein